MDTLFIVPTPLNQLIYLAWHVCTWFSKPVLAYRLHYILLGSHAYRNAFGLEGHLILMFINRFPFSIKGNSKHI